MSHPTSLSAEAITRFINQINSAHEIYTDQYPGAMSYRQPIHTIYGGAHLFKRTTIAKMGELALKTLSNYAPDGKALRLALAQDPCQDELWEVIYQRVVNKISREPVEDFRIDFEDGFGPRSDEEEDQTSIHAAQEVIAAAEAGMLPPYIGIRIKPLHATGVKRGLRTLDLFLTQIACYRGSLAERLLITLPKIEYREQVVILCQALDALEKSLHWTPGILKVELMVETTMSIFDHEGRVALRPLVDLCRGRCFGAHFGTYDYTASCDVISAEQRMDHPICDFARDHMKVALAGSGVFLSDGATNIMPVPSNAIDGQADTPLRHQRNCQDVHQAWQLSFGHILNSLRHGIYQGWDLHPGQVPIRYATVYFYFLQHLDQASHRLNRFLSQAAKATLSGTVFDDAATGQGLLNFFIRAWECGAIDQVDLEKTGLTLADLKTKSFPRILAKRRSS